MKYKAPAVHQAIEVLELLICSGPYTLAQIAEQTGFSKATILRLLETMEAHNWIKKSVNDKSYESTVIIRQKDDISQDLETLIQKILDELCNKTNNTIEWYHIRDNYAEIVQRSEPTDRIVSIRAQLGFKRYFNHELESVTRVAMASGRVSCQDTIPPTGYKYYKNGEQIQMSLNEALAMIANIDDTLLTYDLEWNSNGIRRHAIGIKSSKGRFIGILAIATSFTPQADTQIDTINQELKQAAEKIAKLYH